MRMYRRATAIALSTVLLVLLVSVPVQAQQAAEASDATGQVAVGLRQIQQSFRRPQLGPNASPQKLRAKWAQQMKQVLSQGERLVEKHPEADNLHEVQGMMLVAAGELHRMSPSESTTQRVERLAKQVMSSKTAPAGHKMMADARLTSVKLDGVTGDDKQAALIQQMVKRYADTPLAGQAYATGAMFADMYDHDQLADRYAKTIKANYSNDPQAMKVLEMIGRGPHVGEPFQASLTRLDGSKLNLPEDLKGKVVIVDFWATWCGPCIQSLPHLKKVYQEYEPKGVEIVGISLDRANKADHLRQFVQQQNMDWVHTYSGKYWQDPTVQKYGVQGIPAIWVLDRSGKVVSTNARSDLEQTLDQALANPSADKADKGGKDQADDSSASAG